MSLLRLQKVLSLNPSPFVGDCIGKSEAVLPPAIPTRYARVACDALRVGDETCARL
jgi:hypothetical protein